MKGKKIKLYNMAFPIWLLWLIPITWFIILPVNFFYRLIGCSFNDEIFENKKY